MNKIIAVDFDGTIVDHRYPQIGPFVPGALEALLDLQHAGVKLILWTIRSGAELAEAVAVLQEAGVELWGINENPTQKNWSQSPKAYAQRFIDDAALGCPLMQLPHFHRSCVDWRSVRIHLTKEGFL